MRPRNKFEEKVVEMSDSLPKLIKKEKEWAQDQLPKYFYERKKDYTCLECTHIWIKPTSYVIRNVIICPKCGSKLKRISHGRKRTAKDQLTFKLIRIKEKHQVVRSFVIHKDNTAWLKPSYFIQEVIQHWFSPKGKFTIMAVNFNFFGIGGWSGGPMSIKKDRDLYYDYTALIHPKREIIPIIKRNGFKRSSHKMDIAYLFQLILSNTKAETLLKTKQIALLHNSYDIDNYWPSVRIAIRNNYIIKDAKMWKDHIDYLRRNDLDTLNAKYVCPENLKEEHQRCIDKENLDEVETMLTKEGMTDKDLKYHESKRSFLDLEFTSRNVKVVVLKSIRDFAIEGKTLKHCVFQNKYYQKENSLILSARKEDERLETIEVSLDSFKISQSHGFSHTNSKFHNEILDLINNNMHKIKELC